MVFGVSPAECPRLSTGSSVGSPDPRAADCCSLSSTEASEEGRPVSAVSTVSSESSSEGHRGSAPSAGADIHLELGPPEAPSGPPQLLGFDWPVEEPPVSTPDPPSPFATATMAPNPQLTYVDRVVMEIIETERMYVRDLRSIVEVRNIRCETAVGSDSETSLCLIVSAQNVNLSENIIEILE